MIITAGGQGEQLCWSELRTRFSARTLLHYPRLDRVLRGAQDPDPAGAMLDDGKDIDLRAVEQVSGEEVQRQDPLRLGPEELRPARAIPARSPVDPGALEDLPDCGR